MARAVLSAYDHGVRAVLSVYDHGVRAVLSAYDRGTSRLASGRPWGASCFERKLSWARPPLSADTLKAEYLEVSYLGQGLSLDQDNLRLTLQVLLAASALRWIRLGSGGSLELNLFVLMIVLVHAIVWAVRLGSVAKDLHSSARAQVSAMS